MSSEKAVFYSVRSTTVPDGFLIRPTAFPLLHSITPHIKSHHLTLDREKQEELANASLLHQPTCYPCS